MDWHILSASASALLPADADSEQSPVINLFKLSKDWSNLPENVGDSCILIKKDEGDLKIAEDEIDESVSTWCDKDLQLWDRDKAAVVESLMKRLRSTGEGVKYRGKIKTVEDGNELPDEGDADDGGDDGSIHSPEIIMSSECEMLISWLDRNSAETPDVAERSHRIFLDNIMSLISQCEVDATNFINYLLDLSLLGNAKRANFLKLYLRVSINHLQRHAWSSIHLAILNTKGIFLDSLISGGINTPLDVVKCAIECAEVVYPSLSTNVHADKVRDPEYYFFIAYLLFRCGSADGLDIIMDASGDCDTVLNPDEYPILFIELCELLKEILLDEESENKHVLLGRFTGEYFPTKYTGHTSLSGKGNNFYSLLLLSIVYADYYAPCEAELLPTKEDYLWYQIHLMISGSSTSLCMAAATLCHNISKEITNIKATDNNLLEKIFAYAYSIALVGGIKESLRLLMSAIKTPCVQSLALVMFTYFENSGLFESQDLNYIASYLWNLEDTTYKNEKEVPYLVQLAFNRKRNVSPELKILLATVLPHQKAMMVMKYVVAENFSEAVNTCFIGSAATRNGMLAIGPLLQKLIKLSTKRAAAKFAILLLAQYSAHVGLWYAAFKCFYCIQDIENCASVLEACCCYLYDGTESDVTKSSLSKEDLCVYFSLVKSLAPTNKRLLELTRIFDCIKISVLVGNGEHAAAVQHCKCNKIFENASHVLRNESHQIYFNALVDYIKALKYLVTNGQQPSVLLTSIEANNLIDLLESAYQNNNCNKNRTVDAIHMLMTFITIVPPRV